MGHKARRPGLKEGVGTDRELAIALGHADRQAFAEVYRLYHARIWRFLVRLNPGKNPRHYGLKLSESATPRQGCGREGAAERRLVGGDGNGLLGRLTVELEFQE